MNLSTMLLKLIYPPLSLPVRGATIRPLLRDCLWTMYKSEIEHLSDFLGRDLQYWLE